MKLSTTMNRRVTVITKNETPYDVDGNKGVTYRLIIMCENDVEKVKCINKDVFDSFTPGTDYTLIGEVDIRNARCGEWKVSGFVPAK